MGDAQGTELATIAADDTAVEAIGNGQPARTLDDLAAEIDRTCAEAQRMFEGAVMLAVRAGKLLIEVKDRLPYGKQVAVVGRREPVGMQEDGAELQAPRGEPRRCA